MSTAHAVPGGQKKKSWIKNDILDCCNRNGALMMEIATRKQLPKYKELDWIVTSRKERGSWGWSLLDYRGGHSTRRHLKDLTISEDHKVNSSDSTAVLNRWTEYSKEPYSFRFYEKRPVAVVLFRELF